MTLSAAPEKKTIVVDGDVLIEWRVARSRAWHRSGALLDPGYYTHCYAEAIGAPLLADLLRALTPRAPYDVLGPNVEKLEYRPSRGPYWHHYLLCKQMPLERQRKGRKSDKTLVWRVEQKLGIDRPTHEPNALGPLVSNDNGEADLLVIEHSHKGFADCPKAWPKSLTEPMKLGRADQPWLVLRWIRPEFYATQFRSELWRMVVKNFSGRIVIVVTADDLRLMGMQISRSLSWERTIDDLDRGMRKIWPGIRACAHVVVSFATAGAVVFSSTDGGGITAHLCYDPLFMHEEWMRGYPGSVVGYTRGLTAAVALDLLTSGNRQKISRKTLRAGVVAARFLQMNGLIAEPVHRPHEETDEAALPTDLRFPVRGMATAIKEVFDRPDDDEHHVSPGDSPEAALRNRLIPSGLHYWRIVDDQLSDQRKILDQAIDIVENGYGDDQRWDFPIARFGELIAIDRTEVEGLSSICALMLNYVTATAKAAPLSIAVFGEPGTGKSFAIRAVAEQLSSQQELLPLPFNLSQFTSPEGIINALHQVRDVGLSGVVPLVFWDEFDSNFGQTELGWLRYFLAPMQDGIFQEGPATHNIGRAIFVFAGGAHTNMSQFEQTVMKADKALKGPDFLSRLKGFVDIVGLNYTDPHRLEAAVALRRAILLRSFLVRSAGNFMQQVTEDGMLKEKANVDPGVVEAFVRIGRYRYATRSMEAIVKMSAISGKAMYERSSLPPIDQMALHVDSQEFLELVEQSQSRSDVPAGVP